MQRIRDEAHRFAITYHREVRKKRGFASLLDEVPGVGPARRKALVRSFGSARGVAQATVAEIAGVSGIGPKLAEVIKAALVGGSGE